MGYSAVYNAVMSGWVDEIPGRCMALIGIIPFAAGLLVQGLYIGIRVIHGVHYLEERDQIFDLCLSFPNRHSSKPHL